MQDGKDADAARSQNRKPLQVVQQSQHESEYRLSGQKPQPCTSMGKEEPGSSINHPTAQEVARKGTQDIKTGLPVGLKVPK